MIFIIVPAVIAAIGLGIAALAAKEEKRKEAEKKARQKRQAQQEIREREDQSWRARMAEQFVAKHELRIKPELLVVVARGGVTDVMQVINTESRSARDLQNKSDRIRKLEDELKEVAALMDVIKRAGHS